MSLSPLLFLLLLSFSLSLGQRRNFPLPRRQLRPARQRPPSAAVSVHPIRHLRAAAVKIYDANPPISAPLGTRVAVSIMVPNDESLPRLQPIRAPTRGSPLPPPILPPRPASASSSSATRSLKKHKIRQIKVGTSLAMDALSASFPPSSGEFRPDIAEPVIKPLLKFLNDTGSYYFVDAYPYFPWSSNPTQINLDYALFRANSSLYYFDPASRLTYTNLLDQMLDAVIFAMKRVGFGSVNLLPCETGWPNAATLTRSVPTIYERCHLQSERSEAVPGTARDSAPTRFVHARLRIRVVQREPEAWAGNGTALRDAVPKRN
ncbi:uncharacterized protein A4U43_C04F20700 [Asparagus officinalis]|uniref:Glucan endo-1,3-beta-D-glucosidase n=1 Tax=Asparagus officinalis TaxID=4686 RepID=A0A5P1F7C8_ASPOF|nr:uncharacterized protein A4U43_C04F20700 [Asparagus officinalis]